MYAPLIRNTCKIQNYALYYILSANVRNGGSNYERKYDDIFHR